MGSNFIDPIKTIEDDAPPLDTSDEAYEEMERQERRQEEIDRGGSVGTAERQNQRQKTFSRLRVREDTHNAIHLASIEEGMSTEEFHSIFVDSFISLWREKGRSADPRVRIFWDIFESRRLLEQRDEAFRLAAELEKYSVPGMYEKLVDICEDLGLDVKDVMRRVKKDPYGVAVVNSAINQSSQVRQRCFKWFIGFAGMREEIHSTELIRAGGNAGFTEKVVRDCAKAAGWLPEKDGMKWVWRKTPIAKMTVGNST